MPALKILLVLGLAFYGLLITTEAQESEAPKNVGVSVGYFEIPVTNLERAIAFYEAVFAVELTREIIDGYPMALFPQLTEQMGATGALAKGDVYVPGKAGPILYFSVDSIDSTLARAGERGAKLLYPKKALKTGGFVAEIEDSEGNRIALFEN